MHPFVSFVVMPIFALANAGVSFAGLDASLVFSTQVALGVALGLLLGKPLGILLSTWVLVRFRVARLPEGLTWRRVFHDVDVYLHAGLHGRHDAAPSQAGHLRGVHPGRYHRLSVAEEIR